MMHIIRLERNTVAAFVGFQSVPISEPAGFIEDLRVQFPRLLIQVVNGRYIAGVSHLALVLKQAWEARRRNLLFADKFDLDLIVRIACDSQITRALKKVGLAPGIQDIVVIAIGKTEEISYFKTKIKALGELSDSMIKLTSEKEKMLLEYHTLEANMLNSSLVQRNRLAWILAEKAALLETKSKRSGK